MGKEQSRLGLKQKGIGDGCALEKTKTRVAVVQANAAGNVTLDMMSDGLYTLFRGSREESDEGLQPFRANAEDEYSVVCFMTFDH